MSCRRLSCQIAGRSLGWWKKGRSVASVLSSWVVLRVKSRRTENVRAVERMESGCGGWMSAWQLAGSRSSFAKGQWAKDLSSCVRLRGGF